MIQIEKLAFKYANTHTPVFSDISLELVRGEVSVILGPSGSGKSTLLRVLMGIEKNATGTLKLDERAFSLAQWNEEQNVFSLVPQSAHLFPWKTVFENVNIANGTLPKEQSEEKTWKILETVQLKDAARLYPSEISLGMASRVAFARTLLLPAEATLFDEPFAALDAHTKHQLQTWTLSLIKKEKIPALWITHDLHEALNMASEIYVLGGSPSQFVEHLKVPVQNRTQGAWQASAEYFDLFTRLQKALSR